LYLYNTKLIKLKILHSKNCLFYLEENLEENFNM